MPTLGDLIKQPNAPAALSLFGRAGIAPDVGGGALDKDSADAQLAQALKFDPNAYIERVGSGPEVSSADGPGYTQYILHMDNSKLPTFQGAGTDASKYGGWAPVDTTGQNAAEIANNPAYVVNDPNYGAYTFRGNLKANPNDQMDSLWKGIDLAAHVAPAVLGGVAGLTGMAGSGVAGGLYNALSGAMGNLAGGNSGGALSSLLPSLLQFIPGAGPLAPYVGLARNIYGASQGNLGSGINAGLTLGRLAGGGNG